MSELSPFHIAFPVDDLEAARRFYGEVLGCPEGRSAPEWIDFDLYGHQIVAHLAEGQSGIKATNNVDADHVPGSGRRAIAGHNAVDGDAVPVPHFGVVLSLQEWRALAERLKAHGVDFVIAPHVRFEGRPGEQATMFFLDPSGNALEFKAFADRSNLFAK